MLNLHDTFYLDDGKKGKDKGKDKGKGKEKEFDESFGGSDHFQFIAKALYWPCTTCQLLHLGDFTILSHCLNRLRNQ